MKKDDSELDKFLDENLGNLKLTTKQAGILLGIIKGVGISSYLAGIKASKLEWHKVADGDLPKDDILADDVSITVLNQNGNKVFYNFLEKVWKLESNNKISKVIAWCKIPSFMEEK